MALNIKSKLRDVNGISTEEKQRIKDFLQGGVYCWCKNRKREWFSLRDLMGGDNFHWQETPLFSLYLKHQNNKDINPIKKAGKDCGWLLKTVIAKDKRLFETKKESRVRHYRWIDSESETL